jgi:hypothetical protein
MSYWVVVSTCGFAAFDCHRVEIRTQLAAPVNYSLCPKTPESPIFMVVAQTSVILMLILETPMLIDECASMAEFG